ncbi:MAG: class I SAM-dependent methyltransferase [bacterium]
MDVEKKEQEIKHGRKIVSDAEFIWGWRTPAGKKRVARRARFFIDYGDILRGKRILEIGCGTGVFTEGISLTGAEITAIDISADLIEKSRERVKKSNVSFCVEDAEDMTFPDGSFDSVIGSSILHHLDVKYALPEIKRVLKKGGKVVFSEPNMMNPQIFIQKNFKPLKRLLGDSPGENAFFKWQIHSIFLKCGFKSVRVKPFDFVHPWLPAAVINFAEKLGFVAEHIPVVREISGSLLIYART